MKWLRRVKLLRLSRIAIAVCFTLTVTFAAVTVYGSQVGNYVIQTTNKGDVKLSISLSENITEDATSRVTINPPKKGIGDYTLKYASSAIMNGVGDKCDMNGNRYIAYSVYLINNSNREVSYDTEINISGVKAGCDEAVRVMVIEGDDPDSFPGTIVAKPEKSDADELELKRQMELMHYQEGEYVTVPFADPAKGIVYKETTSTFGAGMKTKYTVMIWLEGCDPDCNDALQNNSAGLKMSMTFIGY